MAPPQSPVVPYQHLGRRAPGDDFMCTDCTEDKGPCKFVKKSGAVTCYEFLPPATKCQPWQVTCAGETSTTTTSYVAPTTTGGAASSGDGPGALPAVAAVLLLPLLYIWYLKRKKSNGNVMSEIAQHRRMSNATALRRAGGEEVIYDDKAACVEPGTMVVEVSNVGFDMPAYTDVKRSSMDTNNYEDEGDALYEDPDRDELKKDATKGNGKTLSGLRSDPLNDQGITRADLEATYAFSLVKPSPGKSSRGPTVDPLASYRPKSVGTESLRAEVGLKGRERKMTISYGTAMRDIVCEMQSVKAIRDEEESVMRLAKKLKTFEIDRSVLSFGELLGSGQFASVYKASFAGSDVAVAVKVPTFAPGTEEQPGLYELRMEAAMLSMLTHPNIVKMRGVVLNDGPQDTLLVVELCELGATDKWLKNKSDAGFTSTSVGHDLLRSVASEVADAMYYLSSLGVVHRDLAARNVLLKQDPISRFPSPRLADFGLSRMTSNGQYAFQTMRMLPALWMAPESLSRGISCPSTDVWSYGVFVWELFSLSSSPYSDGPYFNSPDELLSLFDKGYRLTVPDGCPQPIYDLLLTMWAMKPEKRPSFSEIKRALMAMGTYDKLPNTNSKGNAPPPQMGAGSGMLGYVNTNQPLHEDPGPKPPRPKRDAYIDDVAAVASDFPLIKRYENEFPVPSTNGGYENDFSPSNQMSERPERPKRQGYLDVASQEGIFGETASGVPGVPYSHFDVPGSTPMPGKPYSHTSVHQPVDSSTPASNKACINHLCPVCGENSRSSQAKQCSVCSENSR